MGLPAPSSEFHSPSTKRHVAICLTPYAYLPGACPMLGDDKRWLFSWSVTPAKPLKELANRLNRSARSLSARYVPQTGDIEILGRAPGFPDLVPLALVGHGLTHDECVAALAELAR